MEQMPEFVSEETLLQYHAKKLEFLSITRQLLTQNWLAKALSTTGDFLSSFTAAIRWRRRKIRKKENFRKLVKKCISRDTIATEMRRKFSRRAREYIIAYRALALPRDIDGNEVSAPADGDKNVPSVPMMPTSLIEKL